MKPGAWIRGMFSFLRAELPCRGSVWFETSAPVSLAVCRVMLMLALLDKWDEMAAKASDSVSMSKSLYVPKGLWQLTARVPDAATVDLLDRIGWWAAVLALVGFATRLTLPLATVAGCLLASAAWSWSVLWSHGWNIVLLVSIAFMFADAGRWGSVDALVRRIRGRQGLDSGGASIWPILLGQLAVALMFALAAHWKVRSSPQDLAWIFSDNLRNDIGQSWWQRRGGPPWLAAWIIDHPLRWKAFAFGNIVAQSAALVACLLVRRPLLRAAAGLFFVVEILGLGLVMGLWHPGWILLYAFFVDWDRLAGIPDRWRHRFREGRDATVQGWRLRLCQSWIVAFVLVYLSVGVSRGVRLQFLPYPFTCFNMFAEIRATPPYDEHRPWRYEMTEFRIVAGSHRTDGVPSPDWSFAIREGFIDQGLPSSLRKRRDQDVCNFSMQRPLLEEARRRMAAEISGEDLDRCAISMHRVVWAIPAWPADSTPVVVGQTPIAELAADGRLRSAGGRGKLTDGGWRLIPWFEGMAELDRWWVEWASSNPSDGDELVWRRLDGVIQDGAFVVDEASMCPTGSHLRLGIEQEGGDGVAPEYFHLPRS